MASSTRNKLVLALAIFTMATSDLVAQDGRIVTGTVLAPPLRNGLGDPPKTALSVYWPTQDTPADTRQFDERAVRAVAAAIIAADNARNLDSVLALYAPDAVLMPPGEEPVRGRDAIRPRYEALFRTFSPAIRSELDDVRVAGSLAFVSGRNTGELTPRDSASPPRRLNDLFLMVLSRDQAGRWRIARLMWHAGPTPPAG